MEIWKDIKGYEGLYQVSTLGNVRRLYKTKPSRTLRLSFDKDGYLQFTVCKNNIKRTVRVHRLVAEAFLDNPHNHPIVNHKDENKQNNNVGNLEWCTIQYNTTYRNAQLRRVEPLKKSVWQMSLDGQLIKAWSSAGDASKALKISRGCISACCLCYPHCKTAGGFVWKYAGG